MSDLRNCPRKFLSEFIDLYKSYPCLWKVKSPQYSNKALKQAAYEMLNRKLKEVDSDSNRDMVIRKIDSLRGSFRKELKKVIQSQRSSEDEVYQPRLWYFEKLLFLVNPDQEAPAAETTLNEFRLDQKFEVVNMEEYRTPTPSPTRSSSPTTISVSNIHKRKSCESPEVSAVNKQPKLEDEFDVIGKNVAHKLRTFPKEIKIVAEKLMNDIFFECEMGNINKYTRLNLYQVTPVSLCAAQNEEIQYSL